MARTVNDIVIEAPIASIMEVLTDFEAYPEWMAGMVTTQILERDAEGRPRDVRFELDSPPLRDTFVLRYDWSDADKLRWVLVPDRNTMLKMMDGSYVLDPLPDARTRVTYQLEVDTEVPLLGLLRRKAERLVIDTALKGLKKQVEGSGRE